jgi:hypothetical protein
MLCSPTVALKVPHTQTVRFRSMRKGRRGQLSCIIILHLRFVTHPTRVCHKATYGYGSILASVVSMPPQPPMVLRQNGLEEWARVSHGEWNVKSISFPALSVSTM